MTAIHSDPTSSAYKKAQRHYLKSAQTAPSPNQSAFRAQEKLYKTRFPRPSLSSALDPSQHDDLSHSETEDDELEESGWGHGYFEAEEVNSISIKLRGGSQRRAFCIKRIPGESHISFSIRS